MPQTATRSEFEADHARWHAEVEKRRTGPFGPLSVTALHWLDTEPQSLEGVPGRWSADPDGAVTVELPEGAELVRDGVALGGRITTEPLTGTESVTFEAGALRVEVAARGGGIVLRPRDPSSADRRDYSGTATFAPDPAWVIEGRFVASAQADVEVESVIPDRHQHYASPGRAEFEVGGVPVCLVVFGENGALRAVFSDQTARDLTFPAVRSVPVRRSGPESVVIDFNRATNPPCAYSVGATCPLPPQGNRLAVRVEAGELRPGVARPEAGASR